MFPKLGSLWLKNFRVLPWLLLLLCAFSVAIRFPFFKVPMITDEGGAAYIAHFWSSDYQPYKDINYDRLQGFFLLYKAIFALLGHQIVSIRLAAAFFNVGTLLLVFFFARKLSNDSSGWVGGLFFAVFSTAPVIEGFTANSELFAVLPLTLSAYLVWEEKWFFAGLLSGFSVLFKPIGISGFLLALIWIMAYQRKWRSVILMSVGFAIWPALAMLHGWLVGWKYFWSTFFKHRAMAFSVFSGQPAYQIHNLFVSLQATSPAWIGLAIFATVALLYSGSRVRKFGLIWIGTTMIGMGLGGNWFGHYYIQIIPPLAILAGIGASDLIQGKTNGRMIWAILASMGLCFFFVLQAKYWLMNPDQISLNIYNRPAYLVSEKAGKYISNHTQSNDLIYVAFGQAELYYYAQRKAAVPQQLFWHQLAANKDLWDAVINSILTKTPAMIAWVQYLPPEQWSSPEAFEALINRGYVLDEELPPIRIYRRRSPCR
jgi:4-amino-4-deoxy-L-arabinose transferase-like glycosyltransferase